VVFAVDILLNFRTTILNDISRDEIVDSKEIAIHYLKGKFIVDLMSAIPFDSLVRLSSGSSYVDILSLFSILRLLRVLRFTKIIAYMNTTENVKLSLKLFKLIFYLAIYLHW
jgi:uncharacterized membrane protein